MFNKWKIILGLTLMSLMQAIMGNLVNGFFSLKTPIYLELEDLLVLIFLDPTQMFAMLRFLQTTSFAKLELMELTHEESCNIDQLSLELNANVKMGMREHGVDSAENDVEMENCLVET